MNKDELIKIVNDHGLWRYTFRKKGKLADFNGADLRGVELRGVVLQGAVFRNADLQGAKLTKANFLEADFQEVNLKYADFSESILQEADFQNADLSDACCKKADLWKANLQGANLQNADFQNAELQEANLQGANLQNADFQDAELREANLKRAYLYGANFQNADFYGADLRGADLRETDLRGADLRGADLRGADLWKVDLRKVKINSTKVSKRNDLYNSKYNSILGFIFNDEDNERIKQERKQRDKKAKEHYGDKRGSIILKLPCTVAPSQIGWAIMSVSTLADGVRLAFTSEHIESFESLMRRALRPDLYGASEDENAIKINRIKKGSIVIDFGILFGLGAVLVQLLLLSDKKKNLNAQTKKLHAEAKKLESETHTQALQAIVPLLNNENIPPELISKANKIAEQELENLSENYEKGAEAALRVCGTTGQEIKNIIYNSKGEAEFIINDQIIFKKRVD